MSELTKALAENQRSLEKVQAALQKESNRADKGATTTPDTRRLRESVIHAYERMGLPRTAAEAAARGRNGEWKPAEVRAVESTAAAQPDARLIEAGKRMGMSEQGARAFAEGRSRRF